MSEWREVALGDVVDVINGDRGRNYPSARDRATTGIPFVNAGHLVDGRVQPDGDNYITAERFGQLRSGHVRVGDVLLCIRGSIGRVAMSTPDVVPSAVASSLVILRPRQEINPRFLLAFFQAPTGAQQIAASDNGVAQPNLGAGEVARFRIALPPLEIQGRIAAVLGCIDDLVENHRQRIEMLEQMAQAIYSEWFIGFRYPGSASASLVDSPLGRIPEDWEVRAFAEIASFVNGFAFKPEHWGPTGRPIIKIRELKQGVTPNTPRCDKGQVAPKYWVEPGDLLFSWSADLGAYRWSYEAGLLNQHLFTVIPTSGLSLAFLFRTLEQAMPQFRDRAQGTTMRHIKRAALSEVVTTLPPRSLVDLFTNAVEPMDRQVIGLRGASQRLAAIRDLLLPKLVTGQIDVSKLDLGALVDSVA